MAVFLMVSPGLRGSKLVRDRTVPSPEMFPALRGCERASKCIPAPRGMWLQNPSGPVVSASQAILRSEDHEHGRHDARCPSPRGGAGYSQDEMLDPTFHFKCRYRHLAEIEINVLSLQCLDRRIPDRETMVSGVAAWQEHRNASAKPVNWRFRTEDARIKLKSLYPSIQ